MTSLPAKAQPKNRLCRKTRLLAHPATEARGPRAASCAAALNVWHVPRTKKASAPPPLKQRLFRHRRFLGCPARHVLVSADRQRGREWRSLTNQERNNS